MSRRTRDCLVIFTNPDMDSNEIYQDVQEYLITDVNARWPSRGSDKRIMEDGEIIILSYWKPSKNFELSFMPTLMLNAKSMSSVDSVDSAICPDHLYKLKHWITDRKTNG